ncbi:MAG: 16S rRNA (cytosine(1402)-N(4))-methyltransferase RsmH [Alphaproteobacteria bacterium]
MQHYPVMLPDVMKQLECKTQGHYIDATFGVGGYSKAMLEAAHCSVIGFDRDPAALSYMDALSAQFSGRFYGIESCFDQMRDQLSTCPLQSIHTPDFAGFDGIIFDLGVSSPQLDQAERGFSFAKDGPLDMRMSQSGQSAADLLENIDEASLADILYHYGEERQARKIAAAIVKKQMELKAQGTRLSTTQALASLIEDIMPRGRNKKGSGKQIHPATRSFQAIRIAVNQELKQLETALMQALHLLKINGKLLVVSFHSLEDRIVKQFMRHHSDIGGGGSRYRPENPLKTPSLKIINRKPYTASQDELSENIRSRSAKLRVAVKIDHPAPLAANKAYHHV